MYKVHLRARIMSQRVECTQDPIIALRSKFPRGLLPKKIQTVGEYVMAIKCLDPLSQAADHLSEGSETAPRPLVCID